jgi:exopolysaccharide biosynthesis polyprenyl glycosylphosphotransferase
MIPALLPRSPRTLILGGGPLARRLLAAAEARPWLRRDIIGVVADPDGPAAAWPGRALVGSLDDLDRILSETRPGRIIVALEERRGRLPLRRLLEARLSGTIVEDGQAAHERLTGKLAIESLSPGALIFSNEIRISPFDRALRRALSLAVAAAGLVVSAPLMLLVALLIKLESHGPVLFVQERAGLGDRRFRLLKFRTMRPATGPTSEWARDNGERITGLGRWLRRFRLDELPQFINVLRGDMDLVGPRPHPASNLGLFSASVPYYWLRSLVRPGVTGWAQIRFGYANGLVEETEKMRYDVYYIKHQSLALDLRILLETARIVLLGRGVGTTEAAAAHAPARAGVPPLRWEIGTSRALHRSIAPGLRRSPLRLAGDHGPHAGPATP